MERRTGEPLKSGSADKPNRRTAEPLSVRVVEDGEPDYTEPVKSGSAEKLNSRISEVLNV